MDSYLNVNDICFSKVDWRVKGNLLRGKDFPISQDGNCPRCQSNILVFVILDEYVLTVMSNFTTNSFLELLLQKTKHDFIVLMLK